MAKIKRQQDWPLNCVKSKKTLMKTKDGALFMLGHIVDDLFYTPDLGFDKWEVWELSDLVPDK